jgi:small subunit ribosomal protein S4e
MGPKKVPYLLTHDARTIRYPDPHIKANDTVQVDIATGKIQEHIKFDTGIFYKTPLVFLLTKFVFI